MIQKDKLTTTSIRIDPDKRDKVLTDRMITLSLLMDRAMTLYLTDIDFRLKIFGCGNIPENKD